TATNIYLSSGATKFTEVEGLTGYEHPREAGTLTRLTGNASADSLTWMPYSTTYASVYGVNGRYNGEATIHTRSFYDNDTTGVILFGSITDQQDSFKIYSSGVLKNFRAPDYDGNDTLIVGNLTDNRAPGFYLSNNNMPLYIINDGRGLNGTDNKAGIKFNAPGIDSINKAIIEATGGGDLHIQANRFVRFNGGSPDFTLEKENEIKILSDHGYVYATDSITFVAGDTAHFTIWAKGAADDNRGVFTDDIVSPFKGGAIQIGKRFTAKYDDAAPTGSGLILLRSENDDVLVGKAFEFRNISNAKESTGELMVQAGQDIRLKDSVLLTQNGPRSILFEAKKTAYFGNAFIATLGDGIQTNGDLTVKAGYPTFFPTADVTSPLVWGTGGNFTGSYANREEDKLSTSTGGDIWFGGNVEITRTPLIADSVDTYIRAFNSIYFDGKFNYSLASQTAYTPANSIADTVLLYAETGNIELQNKLGDTVRYDISANDSTYLLIQAGNGLGNPCGLTQNFLDNEWHGNILFGPGKVFAVNHKGVGPTLISAARDIENQKGAKFNFTYENTNLATDGDNLLITAGRHIETHAPYTFDFETAGTGITNDITLQAGHRANGDCTFNLYKAPETASNLNYNLGTLDKDNTFAQGGSGNGSILLFDSLSYVYKGKGNIFLTALNGDIVSDPYLHGVYPGGAAITVNHNESDGITRLEAIDIKLHDKLDYIAETGAASLKNGQFYLAAYDSILTRNLKYTNPTDTGSVFITAAKYKNAASCVDYDCSADAGGILHGHIVLGYGADASNSNSNDSIIFNFGNQTEGANVHILAGFEGFEKNTFNGKARSDLFPTGPDRGKGYGGNITFDYMEFQMAPGNARQSGFTEIRTPNGNIWGKDSIVYSAKNGDLLIDAGLGSVDDSLAILWSGQSQNCCATDILNTEILSNCCTEPSWRTGNIMMKGAHLNFNDGSGDAIFRTREGFIDLYDAFTVDKMSGDLLVYAGTDNLAEGRKNSYGDASTRDFAFNPIAQNGNIFFGADDNIMLNYGNSNQFYSAYGYANNVYGKGFPGKYDVTDVNNASNPYYSTSYHTLTDNAATYDVNKDGYLFYKNDSYTSLAYHKMYRGNKENGARD
ncbi:MAG: hypothetical protein LBR08_03220, partial [Bacteroidales bacterium]|nr:hypothetical protein [Bacteroidales bacterium]